MGMTVRWPSETARKALHEKYVEEREDRELERQLKKEQLKKLRLENSKERLHNFSAEEKEIIVNTPITLDRFQAWDNYKYEEVILEHFPKNNRTVTIKMYPTTCFESVIEYCEVLRRKYLETKNEHYFDMLVHLLPSSYKGM